MVEVVLNSERRMIGYLHFTFCEKWFHIIVLSFDIATNLSSINSGLEFYIYLKTENKFNLFILIFFVM